MCGGGVGVQPGGWQALLRRVQRALDAQLHPVHRRRFFEAFTAQSPMQSGSALLPEADMDDVSQSLQYLDE